MKFDMHCHTSEGSIDSKVSVIEYAHQLKKQGYQGMLVTDHDSYNGYRYAAAHPETIPNGFHVIRGIEYDTRDAGHFLVIMPDHVELRLLELRGMSVDQLTTVVHSLGGVLGPAHPYGMNSSSAMYMHRMKQDPEVLRRFDFCEGFNSCDRVSDNERARDLAEKYDLLCVGGSDSHKTDYIGTAYTEFDGPITSCNDMIECIRDHGVTSYGGSEREYSWKNWLRYSFPTTWSFKAFNRGLGLALTPSRNMKLNRLGLSAITDFGI